MKFLLGTLISFAFSTSVMADAVKKQPAADAHDKHHGQHMQKTELAPEVNLDEFKKLVDSKTATIIDVNSIDTFKSGHVPGAINFAQNEKNFSRMLPADKSSLIVAYCGGPLCTAWEDAAKKAKDLGYTNVKHFKGGIKVWKEKGFAVEKPSAGKTG